MTLLRRLLVVVLSVGISFGLLSSNLSAAAVGSVGMTQPAHTYDDRVEYPTETFAVGRPSGVSPGSGVGAHGDFFRHDVGFVAAETGGQVLKGPIADAIPKSLPEQLALNAAKEGRGTQIMANLGDTPRLVANYGEGDWVKMQYVLRGTDSNITVHYFRNLTTKMDVEFKFP